MVFDVLSVDRESVAGEPYAERWRILESLQLDGPHWRTPETFDDGAALWEARRCRERRAGRADPPVRAVPARLVPADKDHWRGYPTDDEGELVFFCPVCAAREFENEE